MSDKLLDTADGLVTLLKNADWGEGAPRVIVARSFRPIVDLSEQSPSADLALTVVPVSDVARGKACIQGDFGIKVFAQKRLTEAAITQTLEDAEIAALMSFLGDVRTYMLATPIEVDGKNVWCVEAARNPAYDQEALAKRQFFGAIEASYRAFG